MRMMNSEEQVNFQGVGAVEGEVAPWIGEVGVRFPSGKVVESVILVGLDDEGRVVCCVEWVEEEDSVNCGVVLESGTEVRALERAKVLEEKKVVALMELGRLGYK